VVTHSTTTNKDAPNGMPSSRYAHGGHNIN
jgi:hypothetical protein